MIIALLVGTLAVTWAWEALRAVLPWSLPSWSQPGLVLAFALIFSGTWHVEHPWHIAVGIAGAAGVLRTLVLGGEQAKIVRFRAGGRIPALP